MCGRCAKGNAAAGLGAMVTGMRSGGGGLMTEIGSSTAVRRGGRDGLWANLYPIVVTFSCPSISLPDSTDSSSSSSTSFGGSLYKDVGLPPQAWQRHLKVLGSNCLLRCAIKYSPKKRSPLSGGKCLTCANGKFGLPASMEY